MSKNTLILQQLEQLIPNNPQWYELCQAYKNAVTLQVLVLTAWRLGLWLARTMVGQQCWSFRLLSRGTAPMESCNCIPGW
jgi:hypothetical protein